MADDLDSAVDDFQPQVGDAVFATTRTFYGFLIRLGQALRWWKWRRWNHMAIIVRIDADGTIWCLQMVKECSMVRLEDLTKKGIIKIVTAPEGVNRDEAVAYAMKQLGTDYGVLTIVSIAVNLLLPRFINIDIRRGGTLICSALVARSWEHGSWDCGRVDPFQITPAEMDKFLNDEGHLVNIKIV